MTKPHWSKAWYYKIELEKDRFTSGIPRVNMALTRKLLRNIDLAEMSCLDIGTTEAVIPTLLKRAGAKYVLAYDLIDSNTKIKMVKEAYRVDFDYIANLNLSALQEKLLASNVQTHFDVVVFSGVLYHLINPLGLLAVARSFCKVGGFFVLETRTLHSEEEKLVLNSGGRFGSEYFSATTGWLDYSLRMVGLEPIHAVFSGKLAAETNCRMAVLCKSHATPVPLDTGDTYMSSMFEAFFDKNRNEAIRYSLKDILGTNTKISFSPYDDNVARVGRQRLFDAVSTLKPYVPKEFETILTLDGYL